jgi:hypothetical protein
VGPAVYPVTHRRSGSHNKFQVHDKGGPQAVLFGSTNWTSNALCAQTNNSIRARSPGLAVAYKEYWNSLKADTDPGGWRQGATV